ncbi:MAG TPA: chromate efflux transporter [Spirochaetota bacterium]|nr:chromate efflux transporter [Spirochaetota bacterium]
MSIKKYLEVFTVSLKLGLTSFGGPIAHIGYYHNEYVAKRKWLDEKTFADLLALCQFLPGPASSQMSIGIGTMRAGLTGGFLAWTGFTVPSAVAMIIFALLLQGFSFGDAAWIHGLKIVAVAIVAQAVLTMWQKLVTDNKLATIAIAAMVFLLFKQTALSQIVIIAAAGFAGLLIYRNSAESDHSGASAAVGYRTGIIALALFFILLFLLPVMRQITGNGMIALADSFYRPGALVFGGGHVVLPLLEFEVVPTGWITKDDFLAGYGAAQALPGPIFTFAAYIGTMIGGVAAGVIALTAVFLPGFLIVIGALPFWNRLRGNGRIKGALTGVNAGVVGILLAALYNPVITSAVKSSADLGLAVILFGMLVFWKLPPWAAVIAGVAGSMVLGMI